MNDMVRIARESDAAAACDVMRRAISQCCIEDHGNDAGILSAWLENKTPATVAGWFSSPANFSVVAVLDSRVVGVAILTRIGKIALCYVDPENQHVGVGMNLLKKIEAYATEMRIESLRIDSTVSACAFYLHNGFTSIGARKTVFGTTAQMLVKRLACSTSTRRIKPAISCACNQDKAPKASL